MCSPSTRATTSITSPSGSSRRCCRFSRSSSRSTSGSRAGDAMTLGRRFDGRGDVTRLLPTTVVGSHPQPEWLIDRALLAANTPPRVRMRQLWRVAPEFLEQAQDDATLIAIRDQERAGIDIVSDGEMRRESYFNRFATALEIG